MPKRLNLAAALALAAALVAYAHAAPVHAAPLVPAAVPLGEIGPVENVHGCHAICELGPAGWHYHVGPRCTRVACAPNPGAVFVWRCDQGRCGWWHPLLLRWH